MVRARDLIMGASERQWSNCGGSVNIVRAETCVIAMKMAGEVAGGSVRASFSFSFSASTLSASHHEKESHNLRINR